VPADRQRIICRVQSADDAVACDVMLMAVAKIRSWVDEAAMG
jgi:hypothetical protein